MTPNKPYLIRALYEWLADNDATPYLLVDTTHDGVIIPPGIDQDGQVVLNIAMSAVHKLEMSNTQISFSARFGGVAQDLFIPVEAVMAIYSKEDGAGMMFADSQTKSTAEQADQSSQDSSSASSSSSQSRPTLKLVD